MALLVVRPAAAAELRQATVDGFNRYVAAYEMQSAAGPFLWIDGDSPAQRQAREVARTGGLVMERIQVRSGGRDIDIPDGIVHHWLGTVFVPGATVDKALALLQAYDRHADIYKPAIARSRLLARDGDTFRFFLRFYAKKVITVVLNSEHEARFTREDATRARSRIVSTRIAEVENPDTPRGAGEAGRQRRRVSVAAEFVLAGRRAGRRGLRAVRDAVAHALDSVWLELDCRTVRDQRAARAALVHARDVADGASLEKRLDLVDDVRPEIANLDADVAHGHHHGNRDEARQQSVFREVLPAFVAEKRAGARKDIPHAQDRSQRAYPTKSSGIRGCFAADGKTDNEIVGRNTKSSGRLNGAQPAACR